jgi:large subunit ribosomal protein L18
MIKQERFLQRKRRVRAKISGTAESPRLSVFKSNRYLYAQVIDDIKGVTLVEVDSRDKEFQDKKIKGTEMAGLIGEAVAKKAIAKKIKTVRFDKSGYKYHGVVKALADGARKGGLVF